MDCIAVSQKLQHYLDGELGRWAQRAMTRHLDHCAACSSGFRFQAQLRNVVASKCREDAPEGLAQRLTELFHDPSPAPEGGGFGPRPPLPGPLGE